MKPVPRSYGVSGELKPVKPNSYGVVNMVSVLVSVADSYATKPLPLKRFRMEAEVGIEHQLLSDSKHHNSQQHKPLRSFPNEINHLTRIA